MQKAIDKLKYGEFEEADGIFDQILAHERRSLDALRGRVLCAGRWKSFAEIRLSDKLTEIDWQLVLQRADECCKWETDHTHLYFDLLRQTMELLKKYSDTMMMLQTAPDDSTYQKRLETISEQYKLLHRRLMYFDRFHHAVSHDFTQNCFSIERLRSAPEVLSRGDFTEAEECYRILNLDHPNDPVILRGWILCAGHWTAFGEMKVTDYRSDRLFVFLSLRVVEARELAPDEYNSYFDRLYELLRVINRYHENELIVAQCTDEENRISKDAEKGVIDVNDDSITDMWTELSLKTRKHENMRTDIEKEFKDFLDDFLKLDRELFSE